MKIINLNEQILVAEEKNKILLKKICNSLVLLNNSINIFSILSISYILLIL